MKGLSLYIHIPYCIKKCPYCDFNSYEIGKSAVPDKYVTAVIQELKLKQKRFKVKGLLKSIYFGGGTPSLLSVRQIRTILDTILSLYEVADRERMEITVEVNPGSASIERLKGFKDAGVNRFIIGVQSFSDSDLKKLGRIHTKKEAVALLNGLRALKFRNYGIDLIFGIPGQSLNGWLSNLKLAHSFGAKHISAYNLTLEKDVPMNMLIKKKRWKMPCEKLEEKMFIQGSSLMKNLGFVHYEISNFARRGFESVHNKSYWKRDTYLGLGAGAHTFISEDALRIWNLKRPSEYMEKLKRSELPTEGQERLNTKEALMEDLMLSLRTRQGIAKKNLIGPKAMGVDKLINKYKALNYLKERAKTLRLTEKGFFLSDEIIKNLASLL